MSAVNGVWHNAEIELPPDGERVLAVKQLKSGLRDICLAHCIRNWEHFDYATKTTHIGPYWVTCGGNNNVIYWMPLPKIPEV